MSVEEKQASFPRDGELASMELPAEQEAFRVWAIAAGLPVHMAESGLNRFHADDRTEWAWQAWLATRPEREAQEAVAWLWTSKGDSKPFRRLSRTIMWPQGDVVEVQPLVPAAALAEKDAEIARLEKERDEWQRQAVQERSWRRWIVNEVDGGLMICRGDHEKGEPCGDERWVPIERLEAAEAEAARLREAVKAARAEEREECAKTADGYGDLEIRDDFDRGYVKASARIAARIRERAALDQPARDEVRG